MSILNGTSHLDCEQAAKFVGRSLRTLFNWRRNREANARGPHGPDFIVIGLTPFYLRTELERFLREGEKRAGQLEPTKPKAQKDAPRLPKVAPPR